MTEPLNREMKVQQNVVPASFVPTPEQYEAPVTQELRSKQSKWAQGYTLSKISYLENQLRLSFFKRAIYTLDQGYSEAESNALLERDIRVAKTAKTIMLDHIAEWAGNYDKDQFNNTVLPDVWARFVQIVQGPAEEAEDTEAVSIEVAEDEPLAPEEMEPVVVVNKPVIPADAPKSEVVPPDQINLGEILGKIATDNSKD